MIHFISEYLLENAKVKKFLLFLTRFLQDSGVLESRSVMHELTVSNPLFCLHLFNQIIAFVQSAAELLHIQPDIACYAKLMTGGVVPLAATLASDAVFEAFTGDSKVIS